MACAQRCRADVPPRGPSGTLASAASLSIPGGSTFEVDVRLLQFVAMVLTALALVPGGAHLFALPNKIGLSESDYFITQSVYRSWALLGIVLIGAAIANVALAYTRTARALDLRADRRALSCRDACDLFCFHLSSQPGNQQLDPGPRRLGTTALAVGVVACGECGDHIFRILFADHLIAVDAQVSAGATCRSAHAT
jgi:hypothetical protein